MPDVFITGWYDVRPAALPLPSGEHVRPSSANRFRQGCPPPAYNDSDSAAGARIDTSGGRAETTGKLKRSTFQLEPDARGGAPGGRRGKRSQGPDGSGRRARIAARGEVLRRGAGPDRRLGDAARRRGARAARRERRGQVDAGEDPGRGPSAGQRQGARG